MFTMALIFPGSGRTSSLPNLCSKKVDSDFLYNYTLSKVYLETRIIDNFDVAFIYGRQLRDSSM